MSTKIWRRKNNEERLHRRRKCMEKAQQEEVKESLVIAKPLKDECLKHSRKLATCVLLFLMFVVATHAQTTDCPADKVCLTQAQAAKYLTLEDTVKAQEIEILALKKAVLDQKEVTVDAKIALAEKTGELIGARQQIVECSQTKELLIKFGRVRKFGLINF